MKLSPILIAAAIAFGGSAIAQTNDGQAAGQRSTAGGVVDKSVQGAKRAGQATKRVTKRAADATRSGAKRAAAATGRVAGRGADTLRNTGQSIERRLPPGPQQTQQAQRGGEIGSPGAATTMGAAGDRGDSGRQQRMDDAYGSWQRQQQGQR